MLRFLLAPRWLAVHAALVVVLVAFTMLGLWQLDHFRHRPVSHLNVPAVAVDRLTGPGGRLAADDVARRVTAVGRYDDARTLLVPGRRLHGRDGYLVVTPLRTRRGVLAVVRGWVRSPAPAAPAPSGEVALTGRLQRSEGPEQSAVDPLGPLPRGQIAYVATVPLLDLWAYPSGQVYDGFVVASAEQPPGAAPPERVAAEPPSGGVARWRNLAYALQWWLFAAAAAFFWGSVVHRATTERRTSRL